MVSAVKHSCVIALHNLVSASDSPVSVLLTGPLYSHVPASQILRQASEVSDITLQVLHLVLSTMTPFLVSGFTKDQLRHVCRYLSNLSGCVPRTVPNHSLLS